MFLFFLNKYTNDDVSEVTRSDILPRKKACKVRNLTEIKYQITVDTSMLPKKIGIIPYNSWHSRDPDIA